jgi:hypothetical protein
LNNTSNGHFFINSMLLIWISTFIFTLLVIAALVLLMAILQPRFLGSILQRSFPSVRWCVLDSTQPDLAQPWRLLSLFANNNFPST